MPFHDILWQLLCVIICHWLCQDGYKKTRADQTHWSRSVKTLDWYKIQQKLQKNWKYDIFLSMFRRRVVVYKRGFVGLSVCRLVCLQKIFKNSKSRFGDYITVVYTLNNTLLIIVLYRHDRLVGRLAGWLVGRSVGWFVGRSSKYLGLVNM